MRFHPIAKVMKFHGGQDYPAPIGTKVNYQGNYQSCYPNGSAGNMATVANACGVKQVFMHLQSCSAGTGYVVTGNTGGSTGPHLHYEIHINGTKVDPKKAFNQDLCKGDVRKMLLDDAKQKGSGGGGGGAASDSNSPAPPAATSGGSTYVPPGTPTPTTGTGSGGETDPDRSDEYGDGGFYNEDGGRYVVETVDGRTYVEMEIRSEPNTYAILPPSSTEFTQQTNSSNEMTGCATDTWKAMVNQSVLQTRREMMYNERYIAKADSVMAYSCFEDSFKKVGEHIGPLFSETKNWVNRQVDILGKTVTVNKELGDTSLDGAIYNSAKSAMISFISSAFPHDVNGGMSDKASSGEDEGTSQSELPCGTMNAVWQTVKCSNVTDDTPFRRFDQLIEKENDPRKYPKNMKCNNTGITQGMIDIANNKSAKFDKIQTYYDKLLPQGSKCADPIKTGIIVYIQKGAEQITKETTYADGVCVTAGCSYQNEGSGEGKCEVKAP